MSFSQSGLFAIKEVLLHFTVNDFHATFGPFTAGALTGDRSRRIPVFDSVTDMHFQVWSSSQFKEVSKQSNVFAPISGLILIIFHSIPVSVVF